MILAGVLDRHPTLRLLLAHSGGALPQLSSRLASCVDHDPVVASRLKHDARFYLGKLWFDAVAYGPEELGFVSDVVSRADGYAHGAERLVPDRKLGSKRMVSPCFSVEVILLKSTLSSLVRIIRSFHLCQRRKSGEALSRTFRPSRLFKVGERQRRKACAAVTLWSSFQYVDNIY
jgi:hypothetical protein